jgi:hypothetical protein
MKNLLTVTAAIEGPIGLLLVTAPSIVTKLLLDSSPDAPAALTVARLAGLALLTLTLACWLARLDEATRATRELVTALVLYNFGAAILLAYAGLALRLSGAILWPAVLVHAFMGAWCVRQLLKKSVLTSVRQ